MNSFPRSTAKICRREFAAASAMLLGATVGSEIRGDGSEPLLPPEKPVSDLVITQLRVTPLALPDPPILASSGCHGPYFLGLITKGLGWGLSQHSNSHAGITMAAMIHAGAVTPQLTYGSDTHYVWLPEGADVIQGPNLRIEHGFMSVPTGPGVGVDLDRDKLARAHETFTKCGMRTRDDEFTMRRFEPAWERRLF